jgi:hypothetical protein
MRYSLKTLLVLLTIGPVVLWWAYSTLRLWERDDRTNIMQTPRVTVFTPAADLDLPFDSSAFSSDRPQ